MEKSEETEYEEEMEQLGIDNLYSRNISDGVYQIYSNGYQIYSNGERMAIMLALKLQKQINKMQNQIDDMKYDILHHPHSF